METEADMTTTLGNEGPTLANIHIRSHLMGANLVANFSLLNVIQSVRKAWTIYDTAVASQNLDLALKSVDKIKSLDEVLSNPAVYNIGIAGQA